MSHPLNLTTALMLATPPFLWAGNAIAGRMMSHLASPFTVNLIRWSVALLILLPLGRNVLRRDSGLWPHWKRFVVLGLLGVGSYNALLYLALRTSSPINVTLVGASMPIFMMAIGRVFFGVRFLPMQILGALLSVTGVVVVLCRGDWHALLTLRLVPGDVIMIVATIIWSVYSWLLARPTEPAAIRKNWSGYLLAQVIFGVAWSAVFATGEWTLGQPQFDWGWPLALALLYVSTAPAIIALGLWGAGVARVGPNIASFFSNLIPLFTALMSSAFLGELPQLYHGAAFMLIVGGIVLSSRR
ncbi:DMT family transporter [Janthinobacterium sp. 17J80-10]|uniref:DMT family transporter n=1 Tax=Janthinobacterium sp. 17J80-10 TaxID=2497863 RepID=UPI00100598CC|nr:DMT family transporter [Janthinobacterium sp. 17J80-10]QAU32997.1 DMT family transporter [Janthinobacterium sp. 17J80-10]